jgi:hypothetical protein
MQARKDWIFICSFNCFSLLLLVVTEIKGRANRGRSPLVGARGEN